MRTMGWVLGAAATLGLAAWALLDSSGDTSDPAAPSDKRRAAREDRPALEGRFVDPVEALRREMAEPLPAPVQGSPVDAPDGFDPKRHILLRVLNAQGEPLLRGEVRITVQPPEAGGQLPPVLREMRHTVTFHRGQVVIERRLVPDRPRVRVRALGEATSSEPFPDAMGLAVAVTRDDLDPKALTWEVDLPPGRRFRGVVRNAQGEPLAHAVVQVFLDGKAVPIPVALPSGERPVFSRSRLQWSGVSDAEGNYETAALPLEDLRVTVRLRTEGAMWEAVLPKGPSEVVHQDLRPAMPTSGNLAVLEVADAEGQLVPDAEVAILPGGLKDLESLRWFATRPNGRVFLPDAVRRRVVKLALRRRGDTVLQYARLVIRGSPVRVTLLPVVAATVQVRDRAGVVLAGVEVQIHAAHVLPRIVRLRTDEAGRVVRRVPTGLLHARVDDVAGRRQGFISATVRRDQVLDLIVDTLVVPDLRVMLPEEPGMWIARWITADGRLFDGTVASDGTVMWAAGGILDGPGALTVEPVPGSVRSLSGAPLEDLALLAHFEAFLGPPREHRIPLTRCRTIQVSAPGGIPKGAQLRMHVGDIPIRVMRRRVAPTHVARAGTGAVTPPRPDWITPRIPDGLRVRLDVVDAQGEILHTWSDVAGGARLAWTTR